MREKADLLLEVLVEPLQCLQERRFLGILRFGIAHVPSHSKPMLNRCIETVSTQ